MNTRPVTATRPSSWWRGVAGALICAALLIALGAAAFETEASRPIGEGELFAAETDTAARAILQSELAGAPVSEAVRETRNDLQTEAISIVDRDGVISASTSQTLVGTALDNPVVAFGLSDGRFAAAAMPVTTPIELDGVVEWSAGDTVYVVGRPLDDERALLFHYDVSELLARRASRTGIEPTTVGLLFAAGLAAVIATALEIGRTRAATRMQVMERESQLLREHSTELEARNTDLRLARTAAEDALALAEEKNRIRSEFVLMINHELRTPLTSVLTGAHLLAEIELSKEEEARILQDMLRDGSRLEEMISQILAVARIENRGLTATVQDVDAPTVWHELVEVIGHDRLGDPPTSDTVVATDASTLAMLVASLTDNALQHGASSVQVAVDSEPLAKPSVAVGLVDDPGLRISVIDDGPGIDPEFLPRVFEKFEKDSFSSGTGLGLYVVRLMAEAIGASVSVSSSGSGTTFQVCLPRGVTAPIERLPA